VPQEVNEGDQTDVEVAQVEVAQQDVDVEGEAAQQGMELVQQDAQPLNEDNMHDGEEDEQALGKMICDEKEVMATTAPENELIKRKPIDEVMCPDRVGKNPRKELEVQGTEKVFTDEEKETKLARFSDAAASGNNTTISSENKETGKPQCSETADPLNLLQLYGSGSQSSTDTNTGAMLLPSPPLATPSPIIKQELGRIIKENKDICIICRPNKGNHKDRYKRKRGGQ